MQLIGMLDSPYVRRTAISLQLLGLPFEHQSISVFSTYDKFSKINPVVKAPTLVCDDGELLMDSGLIIEYAEALAAPRKSLMPAAIAERQHALHIIGVAQAAVDKGVQIVYEHNVRPAEKLHEPWMERVSRQMLAALDLLEAELKARPLAVTSEAINQAGVCVAVGWNFLQQMIPEVIPAASYPALSAHSRQAELLPEFKAAPFGDGTYPCAA
ncbi:glutathione S-transferase [Undibacterium terreum]|uniref:Glutathione S-transferase n=1 Tax=Undibacterium terreum TaxID=1224302 RepID=A0A916UBQ9_9BURK|nr:glutathione S-transferase [Undibacterium terreum]GGC67069.1 glutathione S-transferase [Undibacterium terreum]